MCNAFNQVLKTLLIAFYSIFFAIAVTACGGGGGGDTNGDDSTEFTLTGVLSGLADGTSIEIRNNLETPITLSTNGQFSLTATSGSDYRISIRNLTDQVCSIENEMGSNLQSDVTNINITCETYVPVEYSLTGQLSGLATSATVGIKNNQESVIELTTNGSFSLTAVSGSDYLLSIVTDPFGQICSIENGSGSNMQADITDITIICVDDNPRIEYKLIGQLEGLTTASLEIQNNQEAEIILSTNGEFSIIAATGSDYELSIVKNPTEKLCTIENGSGSNLQADVTNIAISCEPVSSATSCSGTTDSDGDGLTDCIEINSWKTNPWLVDTDGDSYLDNEEIALFDPVNNLYIKNPRIADMPAISIDLTSLPHVEMAYTISGGSSQSISSSHGTGTSSSISHDWGGENSQQVEIGHTATASATVTTGIEIEIGKEGGVTGSLETSLGVGFEASQNETTGSVVNWTSTEEQSNSTTYEESVTASEESGFEYTNGTMEITASIRNSGHIAYDLENLTLTSFFFSPERPFEMEPIGTLSYNGGDFPTTSILPGESPPLNFSVDVSLQKYQRLLRDSGNIVIMPATYRLLDNGGTSILLQNDFVSVLTASITIDYGIHAAKQDRYRVAVNNGDGNKSISLNDALQDILGLTVSQGAGQWIYGSEVSVTTTPTGLLSIGNYSMDVNTNQYWLVAHNHTTDAGADRTTDFYHLLNEGYGLDNIQLRAGDKITLVYVGDADRDGLSDRLEREYGTAADNADTDGDNLMDAIEIYGWYSNLISPPCDVGDTLTVIYSDPLLADSDGDGINDDVEKADCNNPWFDFQAKAGDDQFVNAGSTVTLYGDIQSTVPVSASYQWQLVSGPDIYVDGIATRELTGREPSFTVSNEVSTLVFELEVTVDADTIADQVKIQVQKNISSAVYVGDPVMGLAPNGLVPYETLNRALLEASGNDIYVMTQASPYMVQTVDLPDGVSLFGGYDANWIRDVTNNTTQIQAIATQSFAPAMQVRSISSGNEIWISGVSVAALSDAGSPENDVIVLKINGGTASSPSGDVIIRHSYFASSYMVEGTSGTPGSNYALMVNNLNRLDVESSDFISGPGGKGTDGASGTDGTKGSDGAAEYYGASSGGTADGGNGGRGGDFNPNWNGNAGLAGGESEDGVEGGAGGTGGVYSAIDCQYNQTSRGGSGQRSESGYFGDAGAGAGSAYKDTVYTGFVPSSGADGDNGTNGGGGGGGGGGSVCNWANGGTGGGGGHGGYAGTGGKGGIGGGASIGIWLDNILTASILNNRIMSTPGGNGGHAGKGGSFGERGAGGSGSAGGTKGGSGGDGGRGGSGGNGGGGTGAPSIGIYVTSGTAPIITGNTIQSQKGGDGGSSDDDTNSHRGGFGGNGGDSYAVFDADLTDGYVPDISGGNLMVHGVAGLPGEGIVGIGSIVGKDGILIYTGSDGVAGNAAQTNF